MMNVSALRLPLVHIRDAGMRQYILFYSWSQTKIQVGKAFTQKSENTATEHTNGKKGGCSDLDAKSFLIFFCVANSKETGGHVSEQQRSSLDYFFSSISGSDEQYAHISRQIAMWPAWQI